jgi:transcriptional regulator of heat shock response
MTTNLDVFDHLTARQIQILKAVIEEYIATAEPVGSETLEKKHNLGVSPATIRNEMVRLTNLKILHQPHTSSGRSPTPMALKYYVENLMKQKDLSVAEEVAVKERIWDYRQQVDKLLREATKTLAEKTKMMAITATNDGDLYYSGAAYILDMPEFYDFALTHDFFALLDRVDFWWNLFNKQVDPFDILLGEEIGLQSQVLNQCGLVYSKFSTPHVVGVIGIAGPSRLNYQVAVPTVRYISSLINEFTSSW